MILGASIAHECIAGVSDRQFGWNFEETIATILVNWAYSLNFYCNRINNVENF